MTFGAKGGTDCMDQGNGTNSAFREVQRIRQFWIWLIIVFLAALCWYGFVEQILMQRPFGSRAAPDIVIIIFWLVFGIALPAFLPFTKLSTEVHEDGIYIQLFPLHWSPRRIDCARLKSYAVRTYRPIREYGGWGIRKGRQGMAYNMSGNRGVQLELADGERVLIGSQKPEELLGAIEGQIEKSPRRALGPAKKSNRSSS
jgi:hypothetical protein